jgi:phytoene synthase
MPDRPELPPARRLASLYSAPALRQALAALTALEREIGASLRRGIDHQLAHTRLAWWREECGRTAAGHATHLLTRELSALFVPLRTQPPAGLAGLVDAAVWDLSCATFDTRRELRAYCERWTAAVIAPLVQLAAPDTPAAHMQALGVNLREIELLFALGADARLGRLRLPLDELAAAQVAPECLARPPWPHALTELLRRRHRELRTALTDTVDTLPAEPRRALRGLIVWVSLDCTASMRAEARLPGESRPRDHQGPLDGWRAWRAARRVDLQYALARPETRRVRAP